MYLLSLNTPSSNTCKPKDLYTKQVFTSNYLVLIYIPEAKTKHLPLSSNNRKH